MEKERKVQMTEENFQVLMKAEEEALITNEEEFNCPICFAHIQPGEGVTLRGCLHQFCKECLEMAIIYSPDAEVKCPFMDNEYECNFLMAEGDIKQVITAEQLQELHKKALQEAVSTGDNSYHCQTPNCLGFCFYAYEVNHFDCPICHKLNCIQCKAIHEDMNCQQYQEDLKRRAANDEAAKATQAILDKMVGDGDAMLCPSCKIVVQKRDGCDWIRCSMCRTEICWVTKGPRWGPKGKGDTSGGCRCRVKYVKCHPLCHNCH